MDPNSPTYGEHEVVPAHEHETAVEHYEKLCNEQLDKIHVLEKRVAKLESELRQERMLRKQIFNDG